MFRILSLTLVAMMLAIPLQVEVLIKDRGALAGVSSALGFGDHPRPWAEDLIEGGDDPDGAASGTASSGPEDNGAQEPGLEASGTIASISDGPGSDGATAVACATDEPVDQRRLSRLMATERRVEEQITRLASLKTELEELLQKQSAMDKASIDQLVNIYKNMKPDEAARILEDLDPEIVVDLIGAMRERDAAPILARLSEGTARKVTGEIALRRSLTKLNSAK